MEAASWWVTAAISISVAIVTGGGSWLLVRPQMKKAEADAAESLTQTAMLLLGEYRDEYSVKVAKVSGLEDRLAGVYEQLACCEETREVSRMYIRDLRQGIAILMKQICEPGDTPRVDDGNGGSR